MQKLIYRNKKGQELILNNSRPFLLEAIENSSNVSTNINTISNVVDGISINNISIKEKTLPVVGAIIGNSKEELDKRRVELISILNPKVDGELTYINNSFSRKIKSIVQDISFQKPIGNMQKFLIQFIGPNPFWMDLYEKKEEVAVWIGNFIFPLTLTTEGSMIGYKRSNVICNIFNTGDIECGMRIELRAKSTVKNPSIINISTREFIKINKTLEAGEILFVTTEFANKKLELIKNTGEKENAFKYLDIESEFLQLGIGDNLFRYDAEENVDFLDVTIYFTPLYLGV